MDPMMIWWKIQVFIKGDHIFGALSALEVEREEVRKEKGKKMQSLSILKMKEDLRYLWMNTLLRSRRDQKKKTQKINQIYHLWRRSMVNAWQRILTTSHFLHLYKDHSLSMSPSFVPVNDMSNWRGLNMSRGRNF